MAESYSVQAQLSATDNGFTSAMNGATRSLSNFDSGTQSATRSITSIVAGLGAFKIVQGVFSTLSSSMDAAISRFDTMQRYPKVMSALGFSAEESSESVQRLADGIDGLPTTLDEVVGSAQRMTAITGNMDKSTDATIALNNAMLASGASTSDASRGLQQYVQMLSTGTVDLQSWKTLQETMPIGLQRTAEAMGFVGESAQRDLYTALKKGNVTFGEFQNQLIDLGTGTGELAELARVNSEGIATSFGNLQNAAAKGLASIIEAFDNMSKSITGKSIAKNLDGLKVIVNNTFKAVTKAIELATPVAKLFASALSVVFSAAKTLSPVLLGLAAAYGTFTIISKVNALFTAHKAIITAATQANATLTLAVSAKTAVTNAEAVATNISTVAEVGNTVAVKARTLIIGLLTGTLSASAVATAVMTTATGAFTAALTLLSGPVGWIVAGVGALTAAGIGLWKWLNKETDASKELNKEQDKLASSTKELSDSVTSASKGRAEAQQTIKSQSLAYQDLVDQIVELSEKENQSTADKKLLKDSVEQLNESVGGLNLMYDQEGKQLSMTAEQMKARIEAYAQQDTANQSQQDLVDILTEQHNVEAKLSETTALREEWNQKLEDGKVKAGEHKEALKGLEEQETALKTTLTELGTEQKNTQAIMEESNAAVAAAVDAGVMQQVISYQTLSEQQKSTVDGMKEKWNEYRDAATDMFDTLSDKQEMSVAQMTANLEENQRVISTWADNIANLATRGVDEGLLNKLRDAGPESAGYVAAMVNSSDEELQRLSETYGRGGQTATDSFKKAFNTEDNGINETINAMVMSAESSLMTSIQTADFKSLGSAIPEGAVQGVSEKASGLADATGEMAQEASDKMAEVNDSHSPSRVYEQHGKNMVDGSVKGVDGGKSKLATAVEGMATEAATKGQDIVTKFGEIATQIPEAFSSLQDDMYNVGMNAMSGLANGITSNSSGPISAAESIASQIASTINTALDIHSPSRVTMESGEYAAEGVEVGMLNRVKQLAASARKVAQTVADNIQSKNGYQFDMAIGSRSQYDLNYAGEGPALPPIYVVSDVMLDSDTLVGQTAPKLAKAFYKQQNKTNTARGRRG